MSFYFTAHLSLEVDLPIIIICLAVQLSTVQLFSKESAMIRESKMFFLCLYFSLSHYFLSNCCRRSINIQFWIHFTLKFPLPLSNTLLSPSAVHQLLSHQLLSHQMLFHQLLSHQLLSHQPMSHQMLPHQLSEDQRTRPSDKQYHLLRLPTPGRR